MKKSLYIALIIILAGAFAVSAFYLGSYFLEGKRQAERFNELSQMVEDARQNASETTQPPDTSAPTEDTRRCRRSLRNLRSFPGIRMSMT